MAKKKLQPHNVEYWQNRAELREQQSYELSDATLRRLKSEYGLYRQELERQISHFYTKYANEAGLTLQEARMRLSATEKKDLLVDIERYQAMVESGDEEFAELIERISARVHITRLEALQYQLDALSSVEYNKSNNMLKSNNEQVFGKSYYSHLYDMQTRFGFGKSFAVIDPVLLNTATEYVNKLKAESFSKSLWRSTGKMVNEWKSIVETGLIRGDNHHRMMKQLSERLDVKYNRTKTLVRTETNRIHNEAKRSSMASQDVEEYDFLATLDSRTTEGCRKLDLKRFKLIDAVIGVNYPPIHYSCRSTVLEALPKWLEEIAGKRTRTARDDDGNTYEVPGDMDYKTWYDKYVSGSDSKIVESSKQNKQPTFENIGFEKVGRKLSDLSKEAITDTVGMLNEEFPHMKGFIQGVKGLKLPNSAVAYAKLEFNSRGYNTELVLNNQLFKEETSMSAMHTRNVASGWMSNTKDWKGVLVHEYAHMMQYEAAIRQSNYLSGKDQALLLEKYNSINRVIDNFVSNESRAKNMTVSQLVSSNISRYAGHYNGRDGILMEEIIAESFAEVYWGENPRELPKQIVELFLKAIK